MRIWGKKFISVICLVLGVILIDSSPVYAAEAEISIENCRIEDGELLIYVNDSFSRSEQELGREDFQITFGDQEIPCTGLKYFSDTDEPVSYIYLVDVSGSINEIKLQNMKDFLKAVTRKLRDQDEICLVTFANHLAVGGFTKDHSEIERQIDGITGLIEDTNLYQGIVECLKMLDSREACVARKALVILSDGEEVQPMGITKDEVLSCLKDTRIPVYTVAMLDAPWLSEQQESAKTLGSFARESEGGVHTAFGLEEISLEEGASRITSSIGEGMILFGDLSEYQPGNGQAYLQVALKVDGKGKVSDGYMVSEHELGVKAEPEEQAEETEMGDEAGAEAESESQEEPGTEEAVGTESEVKTDTEEQTGIFPLLPVITAALFFGCLIFVLVRHKNKKMEVLADLTENEKSEAPIEHVPEKSEKTAAVSGEEESMDLSIQEVQPLRDTRTEKENIPSAVIYMTKIGLSEEKTYTLYIQGETTLGRQSLEADYAFPEDSHMSGVHCSLICYDGKIILQDKGSRNGTWINGIPVTQPYALKCDDVLHIGKTDFRVHW